ncbi:hypothetical protein [Amycolatopsis keratiniphila]|uniref:hypothetical protein n=1 Tax=Amycolatopsis keratiniphila TaxID=129921 RepID=UPI00087CDCDD|nr:hypothetical protein [Amycolatopsis keratiniphila]OLZ47244.1 hypothetical protein BS330_34800 [Amycolatopsis keratiniphila subsp. nogabecina]SDU38871.1 hypothetical protein SAMN04489733_3660 [Amycolatopsis keratiniphila]
MRTREKAALAVAGLAVAAAGGTVFAGTSGAVGPSPAPSVQAAETSCVTDGAGMCTVQHALGAIPAVVVVSANTPGQFNGYMLNTVQGSYTATTFKVRAMFDQTTPKVGGAIWFSYAAYGGVTATTSPTPTKLPTTQTTPSATRPPTTTQQPTTTPPGTTTTGAPPGGGSGLGG